MLTISQAAKSTAYAFARSNGYGIADAIEQARSANAFRSVAINAVEEAIAKFSKRKAA